MLGPWGTAGQWMTPRAWGCALLRGLLLLLLDPDCHRFTLRPETAIERKTKEGPWFKNPSGLSRFPGNVPLYTIHKGHEDRRRRPGTAQPNRSKPREYGDPNPGATAPRTPAEIKDLEDENKKLKAQLAKLQKKGERRTRLTRLLQAEEARAEEDKSAMNEPYQLRQRQLQLQAEIEELEQMEVMTHASTQPSACLSQP